MRQPAGLLLVGTVPLRADSPFERRYCPSRRSSSFKALLLFFFTRNIPRGRVDTLVVRSMCVVIFLKTVDVMKDLAKYSRLGAHQPAGLLLVGTVPLRVATVLSSIASLFKRSDCLFTRQRCRG